MSRWVRIAAVAECPAVGAIERTVEGQVIALVRTTVLHTAELSTGELHAQEQWHAIDGVCPHQGGPLGKGVLDGATLTCPWHRWQFNVRTGQHLLRPSLCQRRYPVKIEGTDVLIDLESEC